MRQYVECRYREGDARTYCYHNDGEPVAAGDQVKVPAARGADGWMRVTVAEVHDRAPRFATKAILGQIEPEAGDGA